MKGDGSIEDIFQTAAHIKEYQLNQDKQEYEKHPEFFKLTIFHQENLTNVYNQCFYAKKAAFDSIKNLARYQLESGQFDEASNLFTKALAIFKYIKSSNPKWRTDGGIKDSELTYVDDNGSTPEEKNEIIKMKVSSLLNISLCEFYLKNWSEVRYACDYVLQLDNRNVKALYRKARSYLDCPSSLMEDYLKAKDLLQTAFNIDNNNNDVKITLDNLNEYIKKEKNAEKKIFKSFYRNVNYKIMKQEEEKEKAEMKDIIKKSAKDPNDPYNGKAQLRMLELIVEMCHTQLDVYERQENKRGIESMKQNINQAKTYRDNLYMLMNEDLNKPSEALKKLAREEGVKLDSPEIEVELYKLKKKFIDEINVFHQNNLQMMKCTNDKNIKTLDELKMKKKEFKERIKQGNNKPKAKVKPKVQKKSYKNAKEQKCCGFWDKTQAKTFVITFIILSVCVMLRYYFKHMSSDNFNDY